MAYIGNDLRSNEDYKIIDDISSGFNGSATSFALQVGGATPVPFPKFEQQLLISVNGVIQEPDPTGSAGFKLTGTNIVFSSAPTNGHSFFGVIYAGADYVNAGGTFPDGSINFPSITFGADTDSGFTRVGSGTIALISNGTKIAQFPTSQGSSGQALITDGSGNLSFGVPTAAFGNITLGDSIIHDGDTNTKIRFPSNDTVTVETAGSERVKIDNVGRLFIGTTTTTLGSGGVFGEINLRGGTEGAGIHIADNDANVHGGMFTSDNSLAMVIRTITNHPMIFRTNNTERMRIASSGRVGIGTTNPSTIFEVRYSDSSTSISDQVPQGLRINNTDNTLGRLSGLYFTHGGGGSANTGIFSVSKDTATASTNAGSDLAFYTKNNGQSLMTEKMRIDSSGQVGIGTASPNELLHISGSSSGAITAKIENTFSSDANRFAILELKSGIGSVRFHDQGDTLQGEIKYDSTSNSMRFATNGNSERMRIDSSGNVGIGTTNPQGSMHLKSMSGALNVDTYPQLTIQTSATDGAVNTGGGILFLNHDGSGGTFGGSIQCLKENGSNNDQANFMRFATRANNGAVTERMRIDSSGNVGIGTTSPDAPLTVHNNSDSEIRFGYSSSQDHRLKWDSSKLFIDADPENNNAQSGIGLRVDGTQRFFIDASGNIGAPSGTNIFNASDSRVKTNVVDLDKGLSAIKSLRPVSFNWIDGFCDEEKDTLYGFIAQEVKAVDNNLIQDFATELTIDDNKIENVLRVNEKFIIPMLVKAIQELSAKVEALEAA